MSQSKGSWTEEFSVTQGTASLWFYLELQLTGRDPPTLVRAIYFTQCTDLNAYFIDFTFTFHFHALEKEMATHSSVLAWRIPAIGEPGGLPPMGLRRVRHDWSNLAAVSSIEKHSYKYIQVIVGWNIWVPCGQSSYHITLTLRHILRILKWWILSILVVFSGLDDFILLCTSFKENTNKFWMMMERHGFNNTLIATWSLARLSLTGCNLESLNILFTKISDMKSFGELLS